MKKKIACFSAIIILFFMQITLCRAGQSDGLTQVSTLSALLVGIYDGEVTVKQLKKHGDFGLGTFNALDGEMVVLDGHVYQVPSDGHAIEPSVATGVPFAAVTFFDADRKMSLQTGLDYDGLKKFLSSMLPTQNIFYAVRIDGRFKSIKTRSVKCQHKPYRPLKQVVEDQRVFNFHDVEGTVVGFISPAWVRGINVPGFHLHFINKKRDAGGHVLAFQVADAVLKLDFIQDFSVMLPHDATFYKADLDSSTTADIKKVEHGEKK